MRKEMHVFDFDGTLFRSPVPHPRLKQLYGAECLEKLLQPVTAGGLGWFQDHRTLSPPYVPALLVTPLSTSATLGNTPSDGDGTDAVNTSVADALQVPPAQPSATHFDKNGAPLETLFIEPVCRRFLTLRSSSTEAAVSRLLMVMTGRDESYRPIIESILAKGQLAADRVILKHQASAGTVKYKVSAFVSILAEHLPERVVYYEDREEQGSKIEAGVRFVQWTLARLLHERAHPPVSAQGQSSRQAGTSATSEVRLSDQYWLAEDDNALRSLRIPEVLLSMVPPHHRSCYMRDLHRTQMLQKLVAKGIRSENKDHNAVFPDAGTATFGKVVPSVLEDTCQEGGRSEASATSPLHLFDSFPFEFTIHYVDDAWSTDSYLAPQLEEQLYKQLVLSAEEKRLELAKQENAFGTQFRHGGYPRYGRGRMGYHHSAPGRGGGRY